MNRRLHGHDEPRQHAEPEHHPQVALEHALEVGRRVCHQVDDLQVVQPRLEKLPRDPGDGTPLEVPDAEQVQAAAEHVRAGHRLDVRGGHRDPKHSRRHHGFHLGRQLLDHTVVRAGQPEAGLQVEGELLAADRVELGRQGQRAPRVQVDADVAQLQAPVEPERLRRAEHRQLRLDGEQRAAPRRRSDRQAELRAQGLVKMSVA